MSSRRPMPGSPGDYDGHADYLEEFHPPTPGQRLRRLAAGLLGIAVGVTVMRWVFNLMDTEPSVLRIFTGPAAFIVGVVVGAFYYAWLQRKGADGRERTGWSRELIGAALFVFGFVIPVKHNANVRAAEHREALEESRRAEAERDTRLRARMDAGVEAMRVAGRHAPPGVVPPGFEIEDRGMTVRVTNVGTQHTDISLSRVIPDDSEPSGWHGCALYTAGPHGEGRYYHHFINPGMSLTFVMYADCRAQYESAELEYRVGSPDAEGERGLSAWWSDSAMAKPEGRETEFWQRQRATN